MSVDSRWFAAYFAAVPLLAAGEILLIGSLDLLHSTNVGAARNKHQKIHLDRVSTEPIDAFCINK